MPFTQHAATPVVLLGAMHHAGLAIARSLGTFGVPVYAIESGRWTPAFYSRYCRGRFGWCLEDTDVTKSIHFLLDVARKIGGKPILIPTTDFGAMFVVDNAEVLRQSYVFPGQRSETSHALVSKGSLFQLAKKFDIPTPDTFSPKSRSDMLAYLKTARFPIVLKVDDCGRQWKQSISTKCIVKDRAEFLKQYDRMQDPEIPNLIIQEYISGGDDSIWMFNGYFNNESECLFGMTGQKIRQCPVYTGAACLAVCRRNDLVQEMTISFMKKIGYRGILDIGYRYDARDRRYKVLDVNPRIGATFRLFVGSEGLDVARALYLDLTGQEVPSWAMTEGRKWVVEDCDFVSSLRYYQDGKLGFWEWIRSFQAVEETSFLSITDPLPMFAVAFSDLSQLVRRIRKQFSSRPTHINDVEPEESRQFVEEKLFSDR